MPLTDAQRDRITTLVDKKLREQAGKSTWPLKHLVTTVKTDLDAYQVQVKLEAGAWTTAVVDEGPTVKRRRLEVVASPLEMVRHELTLERGELSQFGKEKEDNSEPDGPTAKLVGLAASARRTQLLDTLQFLVGDSDADKIGKPVATLTTATVCKVLEGWPAGARTLLVFQPMDKATKEALIAAGVEVVVHPTETPFVIKHKKSDLCLVGLLLRGPKPYLVRYEAYDLGASAAQDPDDADKAIVGVEERRGFRIQPRTYFSPFGGAP